MTDAWVLYPELRDQVIALAGNLDEADLQRTVPLTSAWTVADVVAHVCGLNADVVAGAMEGLGSDESTAAQVSSRAGMTTEEVCAEWVGHADAMQAVAAGIPNLEERLAADLVVHLHDVQHALGLPIDEADAAVISASRTYATRSVERWLASTGLKVAIELSDGHREVADGGEPDLTLRVSPYDLVRSVSGRRSRRQVEALDWSGPAEAIIDDFSPYSDLGSVDAGI